MNRTMLFSGDINKIVNKGLEGNNEHWQEKNFTVMVKGIIPCEVNYFYNASKNAVIVPTPLAVNLLFQNQNLNPVMSKP